MTYLTWKDMWQCNTLPNLVTTLGITNSATTDKDEDVAIAPNKAATVAKSPTNAGKTIPADERKTPP